MIIGIDVGGTFTDAVVLDKGSGEIRQSVKVPTLHDNLPGSLEQALKAVLKDVEPGKITRVTLSTTIVTNLIAERKFSPVGLLIIPGPGLKPDYISFAATTIVLTGAIDHRGRVTMPVDPREVRAAVKQFKVAGINQVAVVSKFSVRNNTLEEQTASLIRQEAPDLQVELGHMCGGQLNFPRRIVNTVLTMATKARYQEFVSAVKVALATLTIKAEVMILKADGGTLPLEQSLNTPVETVFSGPAASVLGALALTNATTTGVVVDIGGTTTDLALILSGKPLMASKGVAVDEQLTQVRSFAIRALPIGGDSEIAVQDSRLIIKPYRSGRAACLGGPSPTPTDALRILGKVQLGSLELAQKALQPVADLLGLSLKECAENVVNEAANIIYKGIVSMYLSWQREPSYHLWKLLNTSENRFNTIIGVGGGAGGLVEPVAAKLDCDHVLPEHRAVANALGAAVARPTVRISLRADTEGRQYVLAEEGIQEQIPAGKQFGKQEVLELGLEGLRHQARRLGICPLPEKYDIIYDEKFNVVRGSRTVGAIYDLVMETPWEIIHFVGGEES